MTAVRAIFMLRHAATIVPIVCMACNTATGAGNERPAVVDVLEAGVDEWRHALEFRSHFVFRQGTVESRQAAIDGRFGAVAGQPDKEDRVTGIFHKSGSLMRLSANYGRAPVLTPDGRDTLMTNYSFDAVSSDELYLRYLPKYGKTGNSAEFSERTNADARLVTIGAEMDAVLNPFSFGGGVDGKPLSKFDKRGHEQSIEWTVDKEDADHLTVVIVAHDGDATRTHRVRFWTSPSPPVIDRIDALSTSRSRGSRTESFVVASDFRRCRGAMLAATLRSVSGPLVPRGGTKPKWIVKEWSSADLGKELPTPDDFVIEIPSSTIVRGLRKNARTGAEQGIDITKYGTNDLARGNDEDDSWTGERGVETWSPLGLAALATTVLIIVVVVTVILRRRAT